MPKKTTYRQALNNISKEDEYAGELFEEIFERAESELIKLSDHVPALKSNEEAGMRVTSSLIIMYLAGSHEAFQCNDEMLDHMEIIGRELGLKIA